MGEEVVVHVVIPAYNAERTIQSAVRSVLEQRGVTVKLVVVDHGSSDRTVECLYGYSTSGQLELVKLGRIPRERRSASRPLERGIVHMLGQLRAPEREWLIRLDADDIFAGNDSIVRLLSGVSRERLVVGRLVFFDLERQLCESYGVGPHDRSREALLLGAAYSVAHHAVATRADVLEAVRRRRGYLLDERLSYGEDLDLTLESLHECTAREIRFVDLEVTYKRLHDETISRTARSLVIALDHLRILHRHSLLGGELAARVGADLLLRHGGSATSGLRRRYGFPGRRWAEICQYPMPVVLRRLASLEATAQDTESADCGKQ